jgi:hypothetical protein
VDLNNVTGRQQFGRVAQQPRGSGQTLGGAHH